MTATPPSDPPAPDTAAASWRRFVVGALVAAFALTSAVGVFTLLTDPWGVFGVGLFPPRVNQDRSTKADLLADLTEPPQLLIYGSSRAWQIEAARVEQATGLRTFNAGVTAGRPADAYVFTSVVHDLWPAATPDYLWLLDVEAFLRGPLPPSLLAESRFSRYLPWRAKAAAQLDELGWLISWRGLKQSWGVWRRHPTRAAVTARWRKRIAADGTVRTPPDDEARVTAGRLEKWSAAASAQYRTFKRLDPEAKTYVRKTLALFDSWGGDGVVVLTPTQPDVLAAAQAAGWSRRHAEVLRELGRLQDRYGFAIVDMTAVEAFDGSPKGFFDATHMTRENQRRMIDAVLATPAVDFR